MKDAMAIIIVLALLLATYLLSSKLSKPIWGGVLPILVLIGSIYIFACGRLNLSWKHIFPFIALNVAYLSTWESGRASYKKKMHQELDKMKLKDI